MGFPRALALSLCAVFGCSLATDLGDLAGDASHVGDAGGEAGDGGGVCAPFACPANAECATFDTGLEQPFHDVSQGSGSTHVTPTEFVSCPDALESDIDPSTSGIPSGTATDSISVSSLSSAEVVLDLDVWLPAQPSGPISAFALRAGASSVSVEYALSTWALAVQASNKSTAIAPRVGAWNHMTLTVTFANGAAGSAKLDYLDSGGQLANAVITGVTYGGVQSIDSLDAVLGLTGQVTTKTTAFYDDVVFRLP